MLLAVATFALCAMVFVDPIRQDPAYHDFADQTIVFGIAHFWNVFSNLPFVLVGLAGLVTLRNGVPAGGLAESKLALRTFFGSIVLVGIGSAYYHLAPTNYSLLWDRLPMTVAFMAFFSIIISEHISIEGGQRLLFPLVLAGVGSVLYWYSTELSGVGDLRWYALIQFLPMLIIPFILLAWDSSFLESKWIWMILGVYALSKGTEFFDADVFLFTSFGGHAIKHVLAAIGPYIFYVALQHRQTRSTS